MAKDSTKQMNFLKGEVPEMPEGYYSSGPNPNLRRFVEEHATLYDAETDSYDMPPFDQPITTTKATAIYNMHSYHQGKKPHDAIRQYIRHYTQPGDIVLDPMCGSGSTALATLIEGRTAIALDLSSAATFIAKNYCTPVDTDKLQNTFAELQAKVKPEMDWLYETRCDRCDGRATTEYTIYSQVFQCPRCLQKVPLFDCVEAAGQTAAGKPKTINACPHCIKRGHVEEIRTRSEKLGTIPVRIGYLCEEGCKPAQGERRHNDSDPKKRAYFLEYDLAKIQEIREKNIPHWTPRVPMIKGYETTVKRNLEAQGVQLVDDLFTKRNLWALAACWATAKSHPNQIERDSFLFGLTAILLAMSKMQGYVEDPRFPNQLMRGTYYIPQIGREYNVSLWLNGKLKNLVAGYKKIRTHHPSNNICISTQSATRLAGVHSNSVDYIFTDPPYSGNVQYGELNFVWEAWLGFDIGWHDGEIIVNEVRKKTDVDWSYMMRQAMAECYRVLKPGRWISLCYHDTSAGTWQMVQDIMAEVGFISDVSDQALYIDTDQKSYNQRTADKVTRRDLVINFRKPCLDEAMSELTLSRDDDATTFAEKARAGLREILHTHPGSGADRLYDELVSRMVRRGEFERHNFDALLRSVAEDVDGRWYLLETADQVDDAESAREQASASRLETFMMHTIKNHPEDLGVHYSEIFEQYLPIKDKPRRQLWDWLPEFFFKTPEGTWRPPANQEERAQKTFLRTSGALRRIKRFATALLEGVPPSKRDLPPNAVTAADWIRQCRRAGLYDLGRVLYEKGGFDFVQLSEEAKLDVEEDYQICVRRSK